MEAVTLPVTAGPEHHFIGKKEFTMQIPLELTLRDIPESVASTSSATPAAAGSITTPPGPQQGRRARHGLELLRLSPRF